MLNSIEVFFFILIFFNCIMSKEKDVQFENFNFYSPIKNMMQFTNVMSDANQNCQVMIEHRKLIELVKDRDYCFDFSNLTNNLKINEELLIYTNLDTAQNNISQFDIINGTTFKENKVYFTAKESKSGFIDIKIVQKNEYIVNKDITREAFYKKNINMKKGGSDDKFFVNIIPTDNNSDLYFFQTNKSSVRDDNKDKINLFYLNDFGEKNLDDIITTINDNPMKRERCINGKVEIFGYKYNDLDKDIVIKISYTRIKGDGIVGPIVSLSVLFVALVVVVAIFIKNTYFDSGYKNRRSEVEE